MSPSSALKRSLAPAVAIWLGGSLACVDTGAKKLPPMGGPGPTCTVPPPVAFTGSASIPTQDTAPAGPYAWKDVVIKGGGFVTGVIVSPTLPGLAYARTDVGGAYRYDPANQRWLPITDWVGHFSNMSGIESIATDPVDPNRVYVAAGEYLTAGNGAILSSTDMGQTWTQNSIAAPMGGNVDGRSMGERLAVDPNMPSVLYFGSRNSGLWRSTDSAQSWNQVSAFPTVGETNGGAGGPNTGGTGTGYGLTLVLFDPQSGTPGAPTPAIYVGVGVVTGNSLYSSLDAGATWQPVAGAPATMMPHHAVLDGCGNIYFTFNNASGPNNVGSGSVLRYNPAAGQWTDVTPPMAAGGFGGIAADAANPGTLLVTTIDRWPGEVYRTTDAGRSWAALASTGTRDLAGADWLLRHAASVQVDGWLGDVELDPFDSTRAFYITGQGLWSSGNVTAADNRMSTQWSFLDDGLEETVVLDLSTPPTGAPLLSGVGDIGGFKHDDLTASPPNGMYANPIFGNTTSIDFAEGAPSIVARVGSNSTSGGARGAYSSDGGTSWTPFATAPQGSNGSGSIAVSADGTTLVWAPSRGTASYSKNNGATWTPSTGLATGVKVTSDRVNPSKFYAGSSTRMYVSSDGGATFAQATTAPSAGRPRSVFGMEGEVWAATNTSLVHSQDSGVTYMAVAGIAGATAVGFGKAANGQTYPAIFVAGSVNGTWGTYRSDDAGTTWNRVDDPQHQFFFINCLAGDQNHYGRVYLGTSGRGIVYGDPR
jgi:hypothetical protein